MPSALHSLAVCHYASGKYTVEIVLHYSDVIIAFDGDGHEVLVKAVTASGTVYSSCFLEAPFATSWQYF